MQQLWNKKRLWCLSLAVVLGLTSLAACGKSTPTESYSDNVVSYEEGSDLTSDIITPAPDGAADPTDAPTTAADTSQTTRPRGEKTTAPVASNTTTTKAPADTQRKTPAPATEKDALSNSLYALTTDKKLTVGYIGGSVTVGTGATFENTGSWRALTTQWLKSTYPNAQITEGNAAIGATGSLHGACRVQHQLLQPYNPDLVFVEFSINDRYQGYTQDQSERYMESLVRMVREHNPYADIVLVYVTDSGQKTSDTDAIYAFNTVATRYHLPVLDVGKALYTREADAASCFKDGVHPNDKGYACYARYVQEFLQQYLTGGAAQKAHAMPAAGRSDLLMNPTYYSAEDIAKANPGADEGLMDTGLEIIDSATLNLSFSGKTVVMCWQTKGGSIYATLDGQSRRKILNVDGDGTQRIILENLAAGNHQLKLVVKGTIQKPVVIQRIYTFQ